MPFLGILDDKRLARVPGTVVFEEESALIVTAGKQLKHGSGHTSNIVLSPQPSNNPNDPLNWSMAKKLRVIGISFFGTILYGCVTPSMMNPAFVTIAKDLDASVSAVVKTSGYFTLVGGICGPFVSALGQKYGKRPMLVTAAILAVISNIVGTIWAGKSYHGFLACKVLQGFAVSPYESLVFAQIGDIFFVHQRGVYTAAMNFICIGVANLTAAVSGPIATSLGWLWIVYLMLLSSGIHALLQILFVPETTFVRSRELEMASEVVIVSTGTASSQDIEKISSPPVYQEGVETQNVPKRKTFLQELAIFNGRFSDENLLWLFLGPFAAVTNLVLLLAAITASMFLLMTIVIALVLPGQFAAAPYNLDSASIGLLSFGPFIGGIIGAGIAAAIADPLIKWCSKRNKGIYEPEYRLIPAVPGLLLGAGLMSWGVTVGDGRTVYTTATMHGIAVAGAILMTTGLTGYVLDAYSNTTVQFFLALQTSKNFLIFGFSQFVNNWTEEVGVKYEFFVWGGLALALCATLPIIFVFGKKYRSLWERQASWQRLVRLRRNESDCTT